MDNRKIPTPRRQALFDDLIIGDLQEMAQSGDYDYDLLLFLQDGYVHRALRECANDLRLQFAAIDLEDGDLERCRKGKVDAIVQATRLVYANLKADGDESTGVRGYVGAAGVLLHGVLVDYSTYLQDLAEHLALAISAGAEPDVQWLAAHTYAALAKAGSGLASLEHVFGSEAVHTPQAMIEAAVACVSGAHQDSVVAAVGRKVLRSVEIIGNNPVAHIENGIYAEPVELPGENFWNIDPMERQELDF